MFFLSFSLQPRARQKSRAMMMIARRSIRLVSCTLLVIVAPCDSFTLVTHKINRKYPIFSSQTTQTNDQSSSPQVVCVGDALLDCIATKEASGWSLEKMTSENAWTAFPGGAPANVATACVKLGTSAAMCACIGTDDDGDLIQQVLQETGVDISLLQRTSELPTRRVMVTRSMDGNREFGGFHENRPADAFADCLLDESLLFPKATTMLKNAQWIVSSTLSLAFPKSNQAVHSLVHHALQQGGVKLFVDVNWRPVFWQQPETYARNVIFEFTQQAHVVKLTDEEAEWLLGIPASEALEHPRRIHDQFPNAQAVLVTGGEKGASYSLFGCTGHVNVLHVNVVETTGAGDAFTAGFLHALGMVDGDVNDSTSQEERQEMAHDVVVFASTVGALTCTEEGAIAAQPTFDQVESFLLHGEKVWS